MSAANALAHVRVYIDLSSLPHKAPLASDEQDLGIKSAWFCPIDEENNHLEVLVPLANFDERVARVAEWLPRYLDRCRAVSVRAEAEAEQARLAAEAEALERKERESELRLIQEHKETAENLLARVLRDWHSVLDNRERQ